MLCRDGSKLSDRGSRTEMGSRGSTRQNSKRDAKRRDETEMQKVASPSTAAEETQTSTTSYEHEHEHEHDYQHTNGNGNGNGNGHSYANAHAHSNGTTESVAASPTDLDLNGDDQLHMAASLEDVPELQYRSGDMHADTSAAAGDL